MTDRKYQEDVLTTVNAYTGFEKVEVAIEYLDWLGRMWPEQHENLSLEAIVQFDTMQQAHVAIHRILTPGLGTSERGVWHKGPFPALVFRSRGLKDGNF